VFLEASGFSTVLVLSTSVKMPAPGLSTELTRLDPCSADHTCSAEYGTRSFTLWITLRMAAAIVLHRFATTGSAPSASQRGQAECALATPKERM